MMIPQITLNQPAQDGIGLAQQFCLQVAVHLVLTQMVAKRNYNNSAANALVHGLQAWHMVGGKPQGVSWHILDAFPIHRAAGDKAAVGDGFEKALV